jgi:predicted Zn-dependent protease
VTRKGRTALVVLTAVGTLLGASPADAGRKPPPPPCQLPATDLCRSFLKLGVAWPTRTITYYVNEAGAPQGFAGAVQAAFDEWEHEIKSAEVEAALPGDRSIIDFVYGGVTTRSSEAQGDGFNVVGYKAGVCEHCAYVNLKSRQRTISEADITFSTSLGPSEDVFMTDVTCPALDCNKYDIQSIAAHEVGHFIGLAHVSGESEAALVMYPSTKRGEIQDRTLGAGDVLGLRALYP